MQSFQDMLHRAGYDLPQSIIYDGEIHRFGKNKCCWYFANSEYAVVGDWSEKLQRSIWKANNDVNCLVPNSHGLCYKEIKETNLWEIYCILTPRPRLQSEKKYRNLNRASLF